MFLYVSPIRQTGVSAPVTQPSNLSVLVKDREFVGITVLFLDEKSSLKAGSIVKVDRFEVSRCSSMYKITDHPFLIRFITLTIMDEVITGDPVINLQSRLDCSTISK
ncbi:hypothetical protein YC2023_101942 [Brassica napus]